MNFRFLLKYHDVPENSKTSQLNISVIKVIFILLRFKDLKDFKTL
jgi:hypothetical protein